MLRKPSFILAVLLGLATAPAFAYSGTTVDVNVPFSFIIQGKVLPAGQYQLMQTTVQDNQWVIQNVKNDSQQAMFTTEQEDVTHSRGDTYVSFKEVNHKEYLSDIWTEGSDQGWHVPVALELAQGSHQQPKMHMIKASVRARSSR
ncbi:MAG: hypothetical protein P8Y94_14835 [Acidobacteriota bacterium]